MKIHPQVALTRLLQKIQPRNGELQKATIHSITAGARLKKSFNLVHFLKIGSHSRKTAIRQFSDLDYLAVLVKNDAKWGGKITQSSTVLNRFREDLQDRYINTTIRRDMQAVAVQFGGGQSSMDIVPGFFSRFFPKHGPVYFIPDGYNGWIETSPISHNRFIKVANLRSRGKLIKVIQLLKWWKYSRLNPIPIQTFHLEMLLAANQTCTGVKSYTQCIYDAFKLLVDRGCRGLIDPEGISGVIFAAHTDAQLGAVNTAARFSLQHASAALYAELARDYEEANRQWDIVFNSNL